MLNNDEEETSGNKITRPVDPFDGKMDGCDLILSPVSSLSNYSSCGESEFEKYCSANSVLGTPSLYGSFNSCTFNESMSMDDSEYGSLKSGFLDDGNLDNFSLTGGQEVNHESRLLSLNKNVKYNVHGGGLNKKIDGSNEKQIVLASSKWLDEGSFRHGDRSGTSYGLNQGFDSRNENQIVLASPKWLSGEGRTRYDNHSGSSKSSGSSKRFDGDYGVRVDSSSSGYLCGGRVDDIQQEKMKDGGRLNLLSNGSNLYGDTDDFSYMDEGTDLGGNDMTSTGFMGLKHHPVKGRDTEDGVSDFLTDSAANSATRYGSTNFDSGDSEVHYCFGTESGAVPGTVEGSLLPIVVQESGSSSESALRFDGKMTEKVSGEEDGPKHSVGEDLMSGDMEFKMDSFRWNVQHLLEKDTNIDNTLLMNSSAAFGSNDWDDFEQQMGEYTAASAALTNFGQNKQLNSESSKNSSKSSSRSVKLRETCGPEKEKKVTETPLFSGQDLQAEETTKYLGTCSLPPNKSKKHPQDKQEDNVRGSHPSCGQFQDVVDLEVCQRSSHGDVFQPLPYPKSELEPLKTDLGDGIEKSDHPMFKEEEVDSGHIKALEFLELRKSMFEFNPLSDNGDLQTYFHSTEPHENKRPLFVQSQLPTSAIIHQDNLGCVLNGSSESERVFEMQPKPVKMDNLGSNESVDDIVNEMEEILLDSVESPDLRYSEDSRLFQSHLSLPPRDGGSTASTSGENDLYPLAHQPMRIDGVEVVGAKQKKGDVSLGERLVGVKEYTVYKIKVWSGNNKWEVERRYRDFFTLYRRLKTAYAAQDLVLPSPWSTVEKESRKIFGNASPDVVVERSALIEECLRLVIHSRTSLSCTALNWFLSPTDAIPSSPSKTHMSRDTSAAGEANTENAMGLGKTISLVVEIRPHRSVKQLLEAQHFTCAGCHKYFDEGMVLIRDIANTLGWGKPRLCEYTGQLFCSSCHTNDTAVLPARVLHHWDFSQYPVSQLAKSYLDSIYDQPMLCVSAVNPLLFSKVPALLHILNIRRKIGSMLPYIRCPFWRSINKGLGSRRYLLESNDFFALRDLIDLSRGLFAALPAMVETVSRKILEHITEQCLVCCDVGVACGAKQACNDPSSLIFPFQMKEVEKCSSCNLVFHIMCFKKLRDCPCGVHFGRNESSATLRMTGSEISDEEGGPLDLIRKKLASGLSLGIISSIFSKPREDRHDDDNVILMGSLPSTSL